MRVELYAEPDHADQPFVRQMTPVDAVADADNASIYGTTIETVRPSCHFTPRVVPFHPEARVPVEVSLIAWQR